MPTRDDVVRRAQAGDPASERRLYDDHFPHVYAYLLEALKHHHEAEDGAQHVFLKVFAALPTYRLQGEPFRNWLFTFVRNHAIDRLRSASRARTTATDPHDLSRSLAHLEIPCRIDDEDPRDATLDAALERLPPFQRQTIELLYTHDLPATQAAIILGRTPNAVRLLHRRALNSLAIAVAG